MCAPMRLSTLRMAVRVGLRPTSLMQQAGAGQRGGGDEPEGGAGNIARHGEIAGFGDLAAVDRDRIALAAGADAGTRRACARCGRGFRRAG